MKMANNTIRKYIYIDKGDKRLFRLMIVSILSLFVVALTTPYEANAETGNLTIISNSQPAPYTYSSGAQVSFVDFTKIDVDTSDYNQIEQLFVSGLIASYAHNAASTSFTITSCGTGGGTATYSSSSQALAWYFTYPSTFTCSPIVLSYQTNIFLNDVNIVPTGGDFPTGSTTGPSLAKPAGLVTSNNNPWKGVSGTGSYTVTYSAVMDTSVTNNYNITYSSSTNQLFTTNITKSPYTTINTNIRIENASGTPVLYPNQGDSTNNFNNNNWAITNIYGQGIALNMSISNGQKTVVVVNATGSTLVTPTPTPTAQPPFTSTDSINTTKGIYNNTESVDIFGSFYPATTTQTDCLFFGFICTDTTINIESNTGYVFISTQGSTSPIQFLSFTPDKNHNYDILTSLDIGTYQAQLFGFAAPGSTCPSGIVYDFPQIPLGCYYPHNITTFQVVNNTPGLFIHWQTKLANSSAIYGDTITVAWNNVTANDIVKIYDNTGTAIQTYPINISTVSQIPVFIPLYTVGTWNATIFNGSNLSQSASAFLNVLPPGAISVNNSFGISMYWSKAVDFIDNPTTLNWNTGSYSGLYFITVTLNGQEVRNNSYTAVPGQIQQAVYSFDTEGTYVAQFLDINGTVQAQSDIQISHVVAQPTSTEPVPSGSEASQSLGNNLITFMAMPAFWGLILWIIIVGAVSFDHSKKRDSQGSSPIGLVAFIMANMEAVIGLWSPFTWYILAITWIFAGIYFYLGRDVTR